MNPVVIATPTRLATTDLHMSLFGAPTAKWQGEPLAITRRQVRALLFYLSCRLQPTGRDRLVCLFWSDRPEAVAYQNLRRLLSYLRGALPDPNILIAQNDQVCLDPARVWSDADFFERVSTATGDKSCESSMAQAAELYRGSFLEGFSSPNSPEYESWAMTEQHRFEQRYLSVLSNLTRIHTDQENLEDAIRYAQRYLEIDELAESMHRTLIELFTLSGKQGAAQHQFELCVKVLERELGKPVAGNADGTRVIGQASDPTITVAREQSGQIDA